MRVLRVLLGLVVTLATLVALFYLEENWRGKHAWNVYARQATDRGEVFDLKALVPPPVPDNQNFAMTPFLAPLFDFLPGTQTWRDTNATQQVQQFGNPVAAMSDRIGDWRKAQRTDWPACQAALAEAALSGKNRRATAKPPRATNTLEAAAAVMAMLKEYEPVLAELRAASERPHARFNIRYEEEDPAAVLLPHLVVLRKCCRILSLRASAGLVLNESGPALADVDLAFRLTDTVRSEPILVSHLVRCAMIQAAMQPVWEGLADRRWTEAQLQALQQRLGDFDFLTDSASAMRGERVFGNSVIAYLRRHPAKLEQIGPEVYSGPCPPGKLTPMLMPRGWFYLEQINYNRLFTEAILPAVDLGTRRLNPKAMQQPVAALAQSSQEGWSRWLDHHVLSGLLLPMLNKAQTRFVIAQTTLDEAVTACALERYHLANGRYPDALAELAPRFVAKLPHDLITGEPLKYRKTDSGRFILYSVGWNETDDGGKVVVAKGSGPQQDFTEGDWVWPSP